MEVKWLKWIMVPFLPWLKTEISETTLSRAVVSLYPPVNFKRWSKLLEPWLLAPARWMFFSRFPKNIIHLIQKTEWKVTKRSWNRQRVVSGTSQVLNNPPISKWGRTASKSSCRWNMPNAIYYMGYTWLTNRLPTLRILIISWSLFRARYGQCIYHSPSHSNSVKPPILGN